MFFLGLFELGSLLSGVATSSKMFIVGRAVAGMGGSGIVNGALTIFACCIPMERRASKLYFLPTRAATDGLFFEAYLGILMGSEQNSQPHPAEQV
jgi:MFS family permease